MNLRWLAARAVDLSAFAAGDEAVVSSSRIPHSVLAETRAKHGALAFVGERLRFTAKVILQRGPVVRFAAQTLSSTGVCAELEVSLAFPDYALRHARPSLQPA